jgi:hypothetical protein
MPTAANPERVGRIDAGRAGVAVEIDARIERLAVDLTTGDAIRKGIRARDAAMLVELADLG